MSRVHVDEHTSYSGAAPRKMPTQKSSTSEQVVQTDPLLMRAVERRFGALHVDLAATMANTQAAVFISKEQDSLRQPWATLYPRGRMWLNPEFNNIGEWAWKCARECVHLKRGGNIFLLTPASIGANWFRDYVAPHARVIALNGRLTFVGHKQPYPKDCMLSVYGMTPGFEVWDWRKQS